MPKITTDLTIGSIVSTISLLLMLVGGAWFIYPLRDLPEKSTQFERHLYELRQTQAIQTEALRTLADVAKESSQARRDIDILLERTTATARRHDSEIEGIKRRLDRLESRHQ
jgi:hypothetical protein